MIQIGPYTLENRTILAPMAGVTDRPFRALCREYGAAMAVSEMLSCDTRLWNSRKSMLRMQHDGEQQPRSIQIAGSDPEMMAIAAQQNVQRGAQIIDINMGCPAKKVCKKAAGSALLKDEKLVRDIIRATVAAVDVPVTLKIRTGWDTQHRNGVTIAHIAEQEGIQALAVHGRTRACAYKGHAEYDTIAAIKQSVTIPVFANGDIDSPQKAALVLQYTGADGLLIGRAAQGRPWIFREINHFLATGKELEPASNEEIERILLRHVNSLHHFYGDFMGVRIARKHVGWYLKAENLKARYLTAPDGEIFEHLPEQQFRQQFNKLECCQQQLDSIQHYFQTMKPHKEQVA